MASVAKREWNGSDGKSKSAWVVRYLDAGGKHRQKTFEKKKDADAYRAQVEVEIRTDTHRAEAERLSISYVAERFDDWMCQRHKDGRIGLGHYKRTMNDVRLHIVPYLGNVKLRAVSLDMLTDWQRDLKKASGMSPFNARKVAQVLKMICDFAIRRNWMFSNPIHQLLGELRGSNAKRVRTFTREEMIALLQATGAPMYRGRRPRSNLLLQCFVHLGAFAGLRIGEIIGLKVENVDLAASVIRVRNSLSRHDGLKEPKTSAGRREVSLPRHVVDLLRAWKQTYYVENAAGLLFSYEGGGAYSSDGFRHGMWGPLLKRAGLSEDALKPTFHFHALRHFAASWRIDAGWSLPRVAREMGHETFDMTLSVYTHVIDAEPASGEAAQALSDRLQAVPLISLPASVAHGVRIDA